jgi:16S rRNA (uracil1498-N3)-methyltransferase
VTDSRLRVPLASLVPGDFVLEREAAHYVTRVHRLSAGDVFLAFDPGARIEADITIVSAAREVRCRAGEVRPASGVADSHVTLIQALGKSDKPERVIRDATALGVERVVFCVSRRTVVRPGDRADTKLARWRSVAVEAARQSTRGDVPDVEGPLPLGDILKREAGTPGRRLCLVPAATKSFGDALEGYRRGDPLTVLIGPEGGLADDEVDAAAAAGFELARFGQFVLRTETVAVAVLGALVGRDRAS